jgi:hypothetical protein
MVKLNLTPAEAEGPSLAGQVVGRRGDHVIVRGRDGEDLMRRQSNTGDPFHVPPEAIPPGWAYQWVAESVFGDQHVVLSQRMAMDNNGWKAVPAERHDGMFLPRGAEGAIRRGGLILCERPQALQDEARAEERRAADQLIADRNASVALDTKKALPPGYEMGGKYRGTSPQVNMSIDPGADIPRPAHEVES